MPQKTEPRKAKVAKPPPAPTANVNPEDPVAAYRQRAIKNLQSVAPAYRQRAIEESRRIHAHRLQQVSKAAQRVHREHDLLSLMTWAHLADFAGSWFIRYAGMVAGPEPPLFVKGIDVIDGQSDNVWPWLQDEIFRLCAITDFELQMVANMQARGPILYSGFAEKYRAILKLVREHEQRDPQCVDRLLAALHKRFPTVAVELPDPVLHTSDGRQAPETRAARMSRDEAEAGASKPTTLPTTSAEPAHFDADKQAATKLYDALVNVLDETDGTFEPFLHEPLPYRLRLAVSVFEGVLNTLYQSMEACLSQQRAYWQQSREDAIRTGFVIGEDDPWTKKRDGKGGLRLLLRRKPDGTLEPCEDMLFRPELAGPSTRLSRLCSFITVAVREAEKLYPGLIEPNSPLARVCDNEQGLERILAIQVPQKGDEQDAEYSLPQSYCFYIGRYWVELKPELIQLAAAIERREQRGGAARPPMTDGQKRLWDALDGRAMAAKELAAEAVLDTSEQTVVNMVGALRKAGYSIPNRRGRGYFRLDAPPDDIESST